MFVSEKGSQVDPSVKRLYLATCGGKYSAPIKTVSNLEVLVKEGYVEVTECRRDSRSKHGAKTCKVKLAWLTDRGKEAAKKTIERFDEALKELDFLLENTKSQISVLAKYLLARWSASVIAYSDEVVKRIPRYHGGWVMFRPFEWDVKAPSPERGFTSVLPDTVRNKLQAISEKLVELELAEWNKLGHNVNGWYSSETLMTVQPIANVILRHYGGFDMPWFIKSLLSSISKAQQEAELARTLEFSKKLPVERIVDYLNHGSYHDLGEFLKTIESLHYHHNGYAHINWNLIEKYAKPKIHYDAANRDELLKEAVLRRIFGVMPSIHSITSVRHYMVFEAVKNAIETWFDTDTLCLKEIPPLRMFWNIAEREEIKRIKSIYKNF